MLKVSGKLGKYTRSEARVLTREVSRWCHVAEAPVIILCRAGCRLLKCLAATASEGQAMTGLTPDSARLHSPHVRDLAEDGGPPRGHPELDAQEVPHRLCSSAPWSACMAAWQPVASPRSVHSLRPGAGCCTGCSGNLPARP